MRCARDHLHFGQSNLYLYCDETLFSTILESGGINIGHKTDLLKKTKEKVGSSEKLNETPHK